MASKQDFARLLNLMLGNGNPNPYMGLDIRGQLEKVGDAWNRFQAQHFPNQYNNMLYYIPDANDVGANQLADRIYNNY